jgi:threonine/homoserine/homoserine lactone efflux protein
MHAPDLAWLASASAFAVAVSATPGPNTAMVTASAANWGFARTWPHMLGIAVGFPVMVLLVALGAGEALAQRPWLGAALAWVGAAYLVWLAWKIATARPDAPQASASERGSRPLRFWQAAAFQWINPKAWVIAVSGTMTYVETAGGSALALATLFFLVSVPSSVLWAMVGVGAARLLRSQRARVWFNRAMAALLVASLAPLMAGW